MSSTKQETRLITYHQNAIHHFVQHCLNVNEASADKLFSLVEDLHRHLRTDGMYRQAYKDIFNDFRSVYGENEILDCLGAAICKPVGTQLKRKTGFLLDFINCFDVDRFARWYEYFYGQNLPTDIKTALPLPGSTFKALDKIEQMMKSPSYNMIKLNILLAKIKDTHQLEINLEKVNPWDFYSLYRKCSVTHVRQSLVKAADRWAGIFRDSHKSVLFVLDCSPSFRLTDPKNFAKACCHIATAKYIDPKIQIARTSGDTEIYTGPLKSVIPVAEELANYNQNKKFSYETIPKRCQDYDNVFLFSNKTYYSRHLEQTFDGFAERVFHVNMSYSGKPEGFSDRHQSITGFSFLLSRFL